MSPFFSRKLVKAVFLFNGGICYIFIFHFPKCVCSRGSTSWHFGIMSNDLLGFLRHQVEPKCVNLTHFKPTSLPGLSAGCLSVCILKTTTYVTMKFKVLTASIMYGNVICKSEKLSAC